MPMTTENYRFADMVLQITSVYPQVHMLCKDYICSGQPELFLTVNQEDIAYEEKKADQHAKQEGLEEPHYPKPYLDALAVHRKMAEILPVHERMLIHGSALALDGQAYLFTAASGTGKSTHARLWREVFGHRVTMINDDKPLMHITRERTDIFGTPWDGKHHLSTNTSAPLKAICFLERSETNEISQITSEEAYVLLLRQCYRPKDREAMAKTLELLETLSRTVDMYRLRCNMEKDAAQVAAAVLTGKAVL